MIAVRKFEKYENSNLNQKSNFHIFRTSKRQSSCFGLQRFFEKPESEIFFHKSTKIKIGNDADCSYDHYSVIATPNFTSKHLSEQMTFFEPKADLEELQKKSALHHMKKLFKINDFLLSFGQNFNEKPSKFKS